jgi:hypothetical protein
MQTLWRKTEHKQELIEVVVSTLIKTEAAVRNPPKTPKDGAGRKKPKRKRQGTVSITLNNGLCKGENGAKQSAYLCQS